MPGNSIAMPGNSMQLLNAQPTETAHEHRERDLLERIDARDREAMREFYLNCIIIVSRAFCGGSRAVMTLSTS